MHPYIKYLLVFMYILTILYNLNAIKHQIYIISLFSQVKSVELHTELLQDTANEDFHKYAKSNLDFAIQHKVSVDLFAKVCYTHAGADMKHFTERV